MKYGYSAVGCVADGRRVFALHPHQDVFLAPQQMCIPVPDAVPTPRAVLAANMETALNIVWDAAPLAGERVLVIGAGVVGLLTRIAAGAHSRPRASPWWISIARARRSGAAVRLRLRRCPNGAPTEQELVVHASASEAGLASGAGLRRLRGAHRRGELVRRPRARAAARRGLPCAAAAADRDPGRRRRTADARPAQPCRATGDWRSSCWPIPPTTRYWTGRRASRICRSRCRAFSHRAACVTSSPMGPSECSASPSATTS